MKKYLIKDDERFLILNMIDYWLQGCSPEPRKILRALRVKLSRHRKSDEVKIIKMITNDVLGISRKK